MRTPANFFPVERFGAVKAVVPVTAGLSAAGVYMVSTDAGEFFLRLHAVGRNGFGEQLTAQRLAAEQGIAPNVILVDEAAGAIISAKVEGLPFGMALAQPESRPRALQNLCETLARLHAIPAPDLPPFDPSLGERLWDEQSRRTGFPAWALPLGASIGSGTGALDNDKRRVLSHNDVNPANLFWDGAQVWMVDWEGAALAHPYLDLATFAVFLNFSDDEAIALLAIQEGSAINPEQQTTFILLRDFARVLYGAVLFSLTPDLAEIGFKSREETPTLSECYVRLSKGELDLKTSLGQGLLAAAILREVRT
jgi:aminoglycoside phosphotransferase (APT) family kinase protein